LAYGVWSHNNHGRALMSVVPADCKHGEQIACLISCVCRSG